MPKELLEFSLSPSPRHFKNYGFIFSSILCSALEAT